MSASEPLKTHREDRYSAVEIGGGVHPRDESGGDLFTDQTAAGVKVA